MIIKNLLYPALHPDKDANNQTKGHFWVWEIKGIHNSLPRACDWIWVLFKVKLRNQKLVWPLFHLRHGHPICLPADYNRP